MYHRVGAKEKMKNWIMCFVIDSVAQILISLF